MFGYGARARRFLRLAIITTALLWVSIVSGAQAPARLLPVDEAATQPDFLSFRAQLQEAVDQDDVDAVMAIVHPNIKASFGGDDDIDAFRRMWKPEEPGTELWRTLASVLALGGSFQGPDTFVAPYTFSRW